jgi:hypothetical protein
MTEEDFLKRWSRRKRAVAEAEGELPSEAKAAAGQPEPDANQEAANQKDEPEFDLASLPPIDSINALTDVTVFLRAGVPADLTRAALRRVWTADPAIRDFVGLAENAWDFTDPAAMPGFGPLELTDDVRRMIASVIDSIGTTAHPAAPEEASARDCEARSASDSSALEASDTDVDPVQMAAAPGAPVATDREISKDEVLLQSNKVIAALQHDPAEGQSESQQLSRSTHGGALPR